MSPDIDAQLSLDEQWRMVHALRATLSRHQAAETQLVETHISYVLVGADHAYKIKKALKNAFLDQSTLALRQHACCEELRLNRRLAAGLYLGVAPITGSVEAPRLGGSGRTIDCAVKMRAFDQAGLWDRLAARHALHAAHVDELVRLLAPFHAGAAVADPRGRLGSPAQVHAPLQDSLNDLERLVGTPQDRQRVHALRAWEAAAYRGLAPTMAERLATGRVRECHGDLHLGNVTLIDGRTTVFDGIEFNDDFRWIDVMSDVAFMAMDLHACGLPRLAHRFVNAYLEHSGDYGGAQMLNYYQVHRALVRAKVELMRLAQYRDAGNEGAADAAQHAAGAAHYLELAVRLCHPARPVLMLTHGFSGSGKTTLTGSLLEAIGAIRIRADVERKRLAGLPAQAHSNSPLFSGLYSEKTTAATYAHLLALAAPVLADGHPAIVDASFMQRSQRDAARRWASERNLPCLILDFNADVTVLRERLRQRSARGADASEADEAVLAAQIATAEPLQDDEASIVVNCRALSESARLVDGELQADWAPLIERLDSAST
jgi:uncharacterized protein